MIKNSSLTCMNPHLYRLPRIRQSLLPGPLHSDPGSSVLHEMDPDAGVEIISGLDLSGLCLDERGVDWEVLSVASSPGGDPPKQPTIALIFASHLYSCQIPASEKDETNLKRGISGLDFASLMQWESRNPCLVAFFGNGRRSPDTEESEASPEVGIVTKRSDQFRDTHDSSGHLKMKQRLTLMA